MAGSKKLAFAKTITWRVIATLTTFTIAWVVTGEFKTGLAIGGIEAVVKMVFYYFHERAWADYMQKRQENNQTASQ